MLLKSKKQSKTKVRDKVEPAQVHPTVLADIPAEKSIEQLIKKLKDPDEIVRSTAAAGLGYHKSEKAVKPLIQALKDNHIYVRHGAAWALGEIKSENSIEALILALNDEHDITRGKAAEALVKIQGF